MPIRRGAAAAAGGLQRGGPAGANPYACLTGGCCGAAGLAAWSYMEHRAELIDMGDTPGYFRPDGLAAFQVGRRPAMLPHLRARALPCPPSPPHAHTHKHTHTSVAPRCLGRQLASLRLRIDQGLLPCVRVPPGGGDAVGGHRARELSEVRHNLAAPDPLLPGSDGR